MEIYNYFNSEVSSYIQNHPYNKNITEIRLKADADIALTINGNIEIIKNSKISSACLEEIFYNMCQQSQNVYEDEISEGFITLEGGCRVGIGGEYYYNKNSGKNILKQLDALNIRISGNIIYFEDQEKLFSLVPESTLVTGPPHSGKTSLLKLYASYLAANYRVTVCDERKEINIGLLNSNYISGIKKSVAVSMATRTLNPQFIVCDEIGSLRESEEILSSVNTGVKFICSAHGNNIDSIYRRPNIRVLLNENVFHRIVILEQIKSKFYIRDIYDV